jgi:hypothetical protein
LRTQKGNIFRKVEQVKKKRKVRGLAAHEMTPTYNANSHAFGVIEAEIAEKDPFGDVNQVKPCRGGGVRDATYENRRRETKQPVIR